MRLACRLLPVLVLLAAGRAWAIGEPITDIRVQNNARTLEDTVRSIAGINIGDTMEFDTLDKVRERLYTSGLFADVNVFWEPHKGDVGVRVVIVIKDKFPWAPVPTASFSKGNSSAGLALGHGNLFGRGKRGLIAGRVSTVDTGAQVYYEDPASFGSWIFYTLRGRFQFLTIPEYGNQPLMNDAIEPLRETKFRSYGGDIMLGVAWFRKVKTSVGWMFDKYDFLSSTFNETYAPGGLPEGMQSNRRGAGRATVTFDFRARENAVMYGNALSFNYEAGRPIYGSDETVNYWKASTVYEQGIRFLRRHNLIMRASGYVGDKLPIWAENYVGGTNLRGFVYRQFTGDTQIGATAEYHFPMFSIKQLDFRGLFFGDSAAIWYRNLPPPNGDAPERIDGRVYLPPEFLVPGFDPKRDIHVGVGAGLRFFLKTVAAPLVGVDVGYGFGNSFGPGHVRLVLVVGA
jgi:outer membrane protein assembly factor BamA